MEPWVWGRLVRSAPVSPPPPPVKPKGKLRGGRPGGAPPRGRAGAVAGCQADPLLAPTPWAVGLTASSRPSAQRATSGCTAVRLGTGEAWVAPFCSPRGVLPQRRGGRWEARAGQRTWAWCDSVDLSRGGWLHLHRGSSAGPWVLGGQGVGSLGHSSSQPRPPLTTSAQHGRTLYHSGRSPLPCLPGWVGPCLCQEIGRDGVITAKQLRRQSPSLDLPRCCAALSPRR